MELLRSKAGERSVRLDPRTKMVMLFAVSTVLLLGGNGGAMFAVRTAMLLFPFGRLAISGRMHAAGLMLAAYLGSYALAAFAAPTLEGIANAITVATATVVSRFVPTLALAYFVFATTTVSEFMAAMGRMRIPDWIVIPMSVLFRFFPTLGQEARAINAAMRMRNITPISRGASYVENCLVPLMSCAVSIGEDLSAAALARGLGAPWPRTNTGSVGFALVDAAVIAVSLVATAALALSLAFPEAIAW
jgi:energy-coupling factor transporter transmembrane protein EcfT